MTGSFTNQERQRAEAKAEVRKTAQACSTVFWTLVFTVVLFTLGWNYGVTEIIQGFGGPDANINLLEGALTVFAVRILTKR